MWSYLSSSLSRLSPIPAFPEYTGPYKVGTVDLEIPVSELGSPSPRPDAAADIHTVQFRIFYPATADSDGPPISWLPNPQRLHVSAYAQFLGLGPAAASFLSFLPRYLHYIQIPVHKNATLQPPNTPGGRWPTAVFSHGLGGNRNTYSHIASSLASHGVVVVCPEHRDGSAAVSLIRGSQAETQWRFFPRYAYTAIPYLRAPHTQASETWRVRDTQIRIRLWELGLVAEALLGFDSGAEEILRANMNGTTTTDALLQFRDKLDVREPGRLILAGHSYGAATIALLHKLAYYAESPEVQRMPDPVFAPRVGSAIRHLVGATTNPVVLLDMWCFPLVSTTFDPLLALPLPAYADVPDAPGGAAVLAVESAAFYRWTKHLHTKARFLSASPSDPVVAARGDEKLNRNLDGKRRLESPSFFYVRGSAHLSQSDFGVLFPWLCGRVFGAKEPERATRLNVRAVLQHLRANGVSVARTWYGDLVEGGAEGQLVDGKVRDAVASGAWSGGKGLENGIHDDPAILERGRDGVVEAWHWIDVNGMGREAELSEREVLARSGEGHAPSERGEDPEKQMEDEIEPNIKLARDEAPNGAAAAV